MQKACTKCGSTTDGFYADRGKSDGLSSRCRECIQQARSAFRAANPERVQEQGRKHYAKDPEAKRTTRRAYRVANPDHERTVDLRRHFGLDPARYDELEAGQDGVCAICRKPEPRRRMDVDHDHDCCPGRSSCGYCIRGLLCSRCNQGLGYFGDSPELLKAAIDYLARTPVVTR